MSKLVPKSKINLQRFRFINSPPKNNSTKSLLGNQSLSTSIHDSLMGSRISYGTPSRLFKHKDKETRIDFLESKHIQNKRKQEKTKKDKNKEKIKQIYEKYQNVHKRSPDDNSLSAILKKLDQKSKGKHRSKRN